MSSIRVVRVLRPLRALNAVPGMKLLVGSLLKSIPGLLSVVMLMSFVFVIFGILGVQLWSGVQHSRCRLTSHPVRVHPPDGVPAACLVDPSSSACMDIFFSPNATALAETNSTTILWTLGALADNVTLDGPIEDDPRAFQTSVLLDSSMLERCLPGEPVNDPSWT